MDVRRQGSSWLLGPDNQKANLGPGGERQSEEQGGDRRHRHWGCLLLAMLVAGCSLLPQRAPAAPAGFTTYRGAGFTIAIGRGPDQNASFGLLMDTFREAMKAQGYRIVSDRPFKLHGARDAQLTELVSSPQQSTRGEMAVIRDVHLHVLDRHRVLYDVLVRAPEQDFDAAKLRVALDTFRLR